MILPAIGRRFQGLFPYVHRPTVSKIFSQSRFASSKPTPSAEHNAKEADRLSEQARMSQSVWDLMVPEKNMGVTHPFFLVLLALTVGLHLYNNHRDAIEDEALRQKRLVKNSHPSSV